MHVEALSFMDTPENINLKHWEKSNDRIVQDGPDSIKVATTVQFSEASPCWDCIRDRTAIDIQHNKVSSLILFIMITFEGLKLWGNINDNMTTKTVT